MYTYLYACMLIRHSGLEQQTNRRCQEEANNPVDHALHALDSGGFRGGARGAIAPPLLATLRNTEESM